MCSRRVFFGKEEAPVGLELASRKEAARPIPGEEKRCPQPYPLPGPGEAVGAGILTGPRRGYRRCPGQGEGKATAGSPPRRVPDAEASNAQLLGPGIDCPQRHNNKVAGSGRPGGGLRPNRPGTRRWTGFSSLVTKEAGIQQKGLGRFSNF